MSKPDGSSSRFKPAIQVVNQASEIESGFESSFSSEYVDKDVGADDEFECVDDVPSEANKSLHLPQNNPNADPMPSHSSKRSICDDLRNQSSVTSVIKDNTLNH